MIKIKRRFKKFRTDLDEDMREYEDILNCPFSSITERSIEKEKLQEYNDRGNLISQQERIYFLVHWEEKIL